MLASFLLRWSLGNGMYFLFFFFIYCCFAVIKIKGRCALFFSPSPFFFMCLTCSVLFVKMSV